MKNVKLLVGKILDLVSEIERYAKYRQDFINSLDALFSDYQKKKYTYFEYEKHLKKMLKGKTKEEWLDYYDAYIMSLMKNVEVLNAQIFFEAYHDESFLDMVVSEDSGRSVVPPAAEKIPVKPVGILKAEGFEGAAGKEDKAALMDPSIRGGVAKQVIAGQDDAGTSDAVPGIKELEETLGAPEKDSSEISSEDISGISLVKVEPSLFSRFKSFFTHLFAKKEIDKEVEGLRKDMKKKSPAVPVKTEGREKMPEVSGVVKEQPPEVSGPAKEKKKHHWYDFLFGGRKKWLAEKESEEKLDMDLAAPVKGQEKSKPAKQPDKLEIESASEKTAPPQMEDERKALSAGNFFSAAFWKNIFSRGKDGETERVRRAPSVKAHLDAAKEAERSKIVVGKIRKKRIKEVKTLSDEARRIREMMHKRSALKVYEASFFGAIANIVLKRISVYLLDSFPDFFKDLYHALRLGNVRVLSNTYVNMMVLAVIGGALGGFLLFFMFFIAIGIPILQVISRTFMMSFICGAVGFAGFYYYPYSRVKQRRRSINTNLPFAINHMSAVSSSGVSPVRMFELISGSKEYGAISEEVEKIVNYVTVFGYDILTALRAVSVTTPSPQFKDFLEGMVSTTQTGGNLTSYFSQKADEAMLNYKLERQKYGETIATYSDIYTGILIAAPLFFVAALSLVSLLGGKIGGIDVNVVIVIGTYVVIPFMNVAFLTFLEVTQPEI